MVAIMFALVLTSDETANAQVQGGVTWVKISMPPVYNAQKTEATLTVTLELAAVETAFVSNLNR